jgi:hypothetical protein
MKLLKEAEYMAATSFILIPTNGLALGAGSVQGTGAALDPLQPRKHKLPASQENLNQGTKLRTRELGLELPRLSGRQRACG